MDDGGDCLMTERKNELVGWWRARRKQEQTIYSPDRAPIYAFYLIVAIFPMGDEFGTPGFGRFMGIIKELNMCEDFFAMFGYYMFLCYGSVINLPVCCVCESWCSLRYYSNFVSFRLNRWRTAISNLRST